MTVQQNGIWTLEEAGHYQHSEQLAEWIALNLNPLLPVNDLGCGNGYYCRYLSEHGFSDVHGWDGMENIKQVALFSHIRTIDLSKPISQVSTGQTICLEVGEHIPAKYEQTFLDNLEQCTSDALVLSWAIVGQVGVGHVNCRPNGYVIEELEKRDFRFNDEKTNEVRDLDFGDYHYFKNTLLIFHKK